MKFIPVIGLEIHAELSTKTKIFCSCENKFGEAPNTLVCPVCSGMPGTLPVLNKSAVELAIKAGLVLDCKINKKSSFDRKNYFYPDLPKAYQITQFYHPICESGFVFKNNKKINIERIHLEEDAGKLIHNKNTSIIDYNRCGVPLIEIVTAPDFNSANEVCDFINEICLRFKYADICDGKLEQGSLRVDVNISVMKENSTTLGTRAEIKNLNSLKSIIKAIEYETKRQTELLEKEISFDVETRRFDENTGTTVSMRKKESIGDYRYMPEPDIPELIINNSEIEALKNELPTMPSIRLEKYINEYNLSEQDAKLIVENKYISDFYDEALKSYPSFKTLANIILNEINRNLNVLGLSFCDLSIKPSLTAEVAMLYDNKKISKNALNEIIKIMLVSEKSPTEIAKEHNLLLSDNSDDIKKVTEETINENEKAVSEYLSGNSKVFSYLFGQIMRKLEKNSNPQTVKEILTSELDKLVKLDK